MYNVDSADKKAVAGLRSFPSFLSCFGGRFEIGSDPEYLHVTKSRKESSDAESDRRKNQCAFVYYLPGSEPVLEPSCQRGNLSREVSDVSEDSGCSDLSNSSDASIDSDTSTVRANNSLPVSPAGSRLVLVSSSAVRGTSIRRMTWKRLLAAEEKKPSTFRIKPPPDAANTWLVPVRFASEATTERALALPTPFKQHGSSARNR